ncbi:hypothetical protein BHM03_00041721 [Ensete ventricosum]|nr:hypothetical protein BHM03_00041721 [Ensete ventricosum]
MHWKRLAYVICEMRKSKSISTRISETRLPLSASHCTSVVTFFNLFSDEMEGSVREKRPRPTQTATSEGDDQEEEMGKFYAVLANIRAARDDLLRTTATRRLKREAMPLWKPRFVMEDFRHGREVDSSAAGVPDPWEPKTGNEKEKEAVAGEEERNLDLSLSLSLKCL